MHDVCAVLLKIIMNLHFKFSKFSHRISCIIRVTCSVNRYVYCISCSVFVSSYGFLYILLFYKNTRVHEEKTKASKQTNKQTDKHIEYVYVCTVLVSLYIYEMFRASNLVLCHIMCIDLNKMSTMWYNYGP